MSKNYSFFKKRFDKILLDMGISDFENINFVIFQNEEHEEKGNIPHDIRAGTFDDIYRLWFIPRIAGIKRSYNSVLKRLFMLSILKINWFSDCQEFLATENQTITTNGGL